MTAIVCETLHAPPRLAARPAQSRVKFGLFRAPLLCSGVQEPPWGRLRHRLCSSTLLGPLLVSPRPAPGRDPPRGVSKLGRSLDRNDIGRLDACGGTASSQVWVSRLLRTRGAGAGTGLPPVLPDATFPGPSVVAARALRGPRPGSVPGGSTSGAGRCCCVYLTQTVIP